MYLDAQHEIPRNGERIKYFAKHGQNIIEKRHAFSKRGIEEKSGNVASIHVMAKHECST